MARKKSAPKDASAPLEERLVSKFGDDVVRMASSPLDSDIKTFISTTAAELNWAIGQPGVPSGRLTVLYGKEGSGKSTLALHILAETQRIGGLAILLDAEHRYSRERAERIGIIPEKLAMLESPTLDRMFKDIYDILAWAKEEEPDRLVTIVVDSISALPTKKLMESDPGEYGSIGSAARIISQEMEKLNPIVAKEQVALVFVGQLRQHLQMGGSPRSRERRKVMKTNAMIGEGSLIYYGSVFIYLSSVGFIGDKDNPSGITARATVRKNSIAPEGRETLFDIDFLYGIDGAASKLSLLERIGIIKQSGSWYRYGEKKFQRRTFLDVLAENPELEEALAAAPTRWREGLEDADQDPPEEDSSE